jgi:undecaprenyl diphosphate synthase
MPIGDEGGPYLLCSGAHYMPFAAFPHTPQHIGIIPDGNRRWAEARGLPRHAGYDYGLSPALELVQAAVEHGVEELTFYGFTQDNTKRAAVQRQAFQDACVEAVRLLQDTDAAVLVVGNTQSAMFPRDLAAFTERQTFGRGLIKVNLLTNYSWQWDLGQALASPRSKPLSVSDRTLAAMGSAEISRIDLVIRWGGRRRLSGFLPIQTIYSDFYIIDAFWPDYCNEHFAEALAWYQTQDVTLGG